MRGGGGVAVIRHPVLPSLLFLTGCGFIACAGVIVLAGVIEALADMVLDADGDSSRNNGATEDGASSGEGEMGDSAEPAAVPALRAPLAKVQGPTSEYVDKVLREGGWK